MTYSKEHFKPIGSRIWSIVFMIASVAARGIPSLLPFPPRTQRMASSIWYSNPFRRNGRAAGSPFPPFDRTIPHPVGSDATDAKPREGTAVTAGRPRA